MRTAKNEVSLRRSDWEGATLVGYYMSDMRLADVANLRRSSIDFEHSLLVFHKEIHEDVEAIREATKLIPRLPKVQEQGASAHFANPKNGPA